MEKMQLTDRCDESFWERCWQQENPEALHGYLRGYLNLRCEEIELFERAGIRTVCDAACGFGAYTLALASNGFAVRSFDVSPTAAALTREGLKRFGYDVEVRVADLLHTGYANEEFDGAFAHSVLDHMTRADAGAALTELCRIVRPGGLVLLSFDTAEEADYAAPHETLPDGSLLYTGEGKRSGMIFHPYDREAIRSLVAGYEIVMERVNRKGEQIVVVKR